jgi:hypothetical protein
MSRYNFLLVLCLKNISVLRLRYMGGRANKSHLPSFLPSSFPSFLPSRLRHAKEGAGTVSHVQTPPNSQCGLCRGSVTSTRILQRWGLGLAERSLEDKEGRKVYLIQDQPQGWQEDRARRYPWLGTGELNACTDSRFRHG